MLENNEQENRKFKLLMFRFKLMLYVFIVKILKRFIWPLFSSYFLRVQTLEEQNQSQIARIQTLEQQNQSQIARIQTLEQQNQSQVARIQTLDQQNQSQVARIQTLEEQNQSQVARIQTLEEINQSLGQLVKEHIILRSELAALKNHFKTLSTHGGLIVEVQEKQNDSPA